MAKSVTPALAFEKISMIASVLCLMLLLAASGLLVCTLPPTTMVVSRLTSNFEQSAYSADDLVNIALAAREYTVAPQQGSQESNPAADALFGAIEQSALSSSAKSSGKSNEWNGKSVESVLGEQWEDAQSFATSLAEAKEGYSFTDDELSHLQDCNLLFSELYRTLIIALGIFAVCMIIMAIRKRWRPMGKVLLAAPLVLMLALCGCAVAAVTDFDGFFRMLHAVVFPQGNWTFSPDSLLITLFPEGFWAGMGIVWLATSCAACIICMLAGKSLVKKRG